MSSSFIARASISPAFTPRWPRSLAALLCSALALSVAAPALADDCDGDGVDDCQQIAAGAADMNENGVLDVCETVRGDLNLDGIVDGADLSLLLSDWGTAGSGSDINADRIVDGADLALLLTTWGTLAPDGCPTGPTVPDWATLIEGAPDPAIVHNAALRAAIETTGLAWRVSDTATGMEFVLIPPGTYDMGCSDSQWYTCFSSESPVHSVTITLAFYMGRDEVTQAQWQAVMGSNPAQFQGYPDSPSRPVERVSWFGVQDFLGSAGMRLPTEAEWEYAYRAGTTTAFHSTPTHPGGTDVDDQVGSIGWYANNSGSQTHAVGQKAGNGFGLHDMSGNVFEWVNDFYSSSYYASSPASDPEGPTSGPFRVVRGGSMLYDSDYCRASYRGAYFPLGGSYDSIGFRAVRTP